MREFKFRAWDKVKSMYIGFGGNRHSPKFYSHINPQMDCDWNGYFSLIPKFYYCRELDLVYQQFTGLKDKNGMGLTEVYEGDIIDENGIIKGSIYEMDKRETDIVIPQLGTKAWESAYKEAVVRGFNYSE